MEYQLIQAYLAQPNYAIGVEIYNRLGSNSFLKAVFKTGETPYNKERLHSEIISLESAFKPALSERLAVIQSYVTDKAKRLSEQTDAPNEIKEAIAKRKSLYAEARYLKDNLPKTEDAEKRREMCFRIQSIFSIHLTKLWEFTNYYDTYQKLPTVFQEVENTFDDEETPVLTKLWHNNYKYVNKYINDKEKLENLQKRIAENETIKAILRERNAFVYESLSMKTI